MISWRRPPTRIPTRPLSQPGITCPVPSWNGGSGWPRSQEASNCCPVEYRTPTYWTVTVFPALATGPLPLTMSLTTSVCGGGPDGFAIVGLRVRSVGELDLLVETVGVVFVDLFELEPQPATATATATSRGRRRFTTRQASRSPARVASSRGAVRPGDLPHLVHDRAGAARPAGRGARLRVALLPRAHAHSGEPPLAVSRRRGPSARVLEHLRPVRGAERGRRGDRAAARRHRHLPCRGARPDRHREGGREHRPAVGRPVPVRCRRGLERRGDGEPRHRSARPLRSHARARRGDEGDLGRRRGGVPRTPRRLRPDLVVAEAAPATASPGARRGDRRAGARPCRRLR